MIGIEILWGVIAAMGVPSAILGLIVWCFKGRIERRDEEQAKKAEAQQELFLILVQSTRAAISLGEATAHAMQRGYTNGDMAAALEYATTIKNAQKDFLAKQGIHALWEE